MDNIFNYKKAEEDDYYRILGCDETSNTEQILAEYKALSLIYHPDKNPDDAEAVNRFQKIVKAKEILADPEKRALYDKWHRSGFAVPFEKYLNLNKAAHTSVHWVTKKKKDLMIGDGDCNKCPPPGVGTCSNECFRQNATWERDPACSLLEKFRNYEI